MKIDLTTKEATILYNCFNIVLQDEASNNFEMLAIGAKLMEVIESEDSVRI